MNSTRTFSTTAELDLRVEYENGPEGPQITAIFVGQVSHHQGDIILAEIEALETKLTADANLEHQLSRKDEQ